MRNKKIRIGTIGNPSGLFRATFTQTELNRFDIESDVVIVARAGVEPLESASEAVEYLVQAMEDSLLRGEIDVAVYAMENLSGRIPEGLAITAVSVREDPSDRLLIRRDAYDSREIFKIKKGGIVGNATARQQAQLTDYRPDIPFIDQGNDGESCLTRLQSGDIDAVFMSATAHNQLAQPVQDVEIVVLNPREFVPAPAQGVMAWQTNRHDTATRQLFRSLHRTEVSVCTNIERRVLQLLEGHGYHPAVYCERDGNGNFHAFAACDMHGVLQRAHISSSTSIGVAEKIVKILLG